MIKAMVITDHKIKNIKAVIDKIIWFIGLVFSCFN